MIWPFSPNWSDRYKETYSYLTEIITSHNGIEQRRSWRQSARRTVSYQTLSSGTRMRALQRALAQQGQIGYFPDEVRRAYLAAQATSGATAVVETVPVWLNAGADVIMSTRSGVRERRTVAGVSGSTVTFTTGSATTWPSGSRISPTLIGTLGPSLKATAATDTVIETGIEIIVEPGTEDEYPGTALTTFNGREVLTHRPNWSSRPSFEYTDPTEWSDQMTGVRQAYRPVPFDTEVHQHSHMIRTPAHLNQTLGLFLRCQGRRGEFYSPSFTDDIKLTTSTAAGSSVFAVEGHDFHDAYNNDLMRRAFAVRHGDGSMAYFRIASMVKSGSGTPRTLVTTTAPAGIAVNPATTRGISWMPVCRFAADELTVDWITDQTAEIMLNIQTIRDM